MRDPVERGGSRLEKARAALHAVESKHGMLSARTRVASHVGSGPGIYHVPSGTAALVRAIAENLTEDTWVAVAGIDDIGWEAAAQMGVDPARVVVVPKVATDASKVLGTLIEGFEVVAVGHVDLAPLERRALAARARKLGGVVLVTTPWIGVSKPFGYRNQSMFEAVV